MSQHMKMNKIKVVLKTQERKQACIADKIEKVTSFLPITAITNSQLSIRVLRNIAKALDVDVFKLIVLSKE